MSAPLKLSDIKVGDFLRNLNNQSVLEVTQLRAGMVQARVVQSNPAREVWIKSTNLGTYAKVDPKTADLSEPRRDQQLVRDHYDVSPGTMAALALLAARDNTPEQIARAVSEGFSEPYFMSMESMMRRLLEQPVAVLKPKTRDAISKVLAAVTKRVVRGDDRELMDVYHAAPTDWPHAPRKSATETPEPPRPRQRASRFKFGGGSL